MNTATTFTIHTECFRCNGFKRAFSTFSVNGGRCLRCNGSLRETVTKPIERLVEFKGDAATRRADSIATIAKALSLVGQPATRSAEGKKISDWGFAYRVESDTIRIFASALTTAPADVRARGWAAFSATARATLGERAEAVIATARARATEYAGVSAESASEWLGETPATTLAA
jgi:hypothetical protein